MYPTAAKMTAALLFAALAWWISDLAKPNMPDGTPVGLLSPVNAAFGFLMGWRISGRNAGRGYVNALGYGWTAAACIVLWALAFWAGWEMLDRSINLFYEGPVEAIEAAVALMVDYAAYLSSLSVMLSMLIGAGFCALVVEWVAARHGNA